jgi:hypothetical protein
MGAHEDVDAIDLKKAETADDLAQLCRPNLVTAAPRVEALRGKRDAASLGS